MSVFTDLFGKKKDEKTVKENAGHQTVMPNVADNNTGSDVEASENKQNTAANEDSGATSPNAKEETENKNTSAEDNQSLKRNSRNDEKKEIKLGSMTFEDDPDGNGELIEKSHKPLPKPDKVSKPIIVKFLSQGKKINNDFVFTGKVGEPLTKEKLPDIPGYKLPDDLKINRKLTEKEQHLNLNYLPDTVDYTIMPVTEGNQVINPKLAKKFKGVVGQDIHQVVMPKIKGYYLYTSRTYQVPQDGGEVKVVYGASRLAIHVTCVNNKHESLNDFYLHGKTGETYTIKKDQHKFKGYELDLEKSDKLTGEYKPETTSLTLTYKPISTTLEVSFFDESGNQVHKPLTYQGHFREPYYIKLPTIDGFELSSSPEVLNGIYTQAHEKVALRFKRATKTFHVKRWFDKIHGQSAGDDLIISGIVGNLYDEPVPVIDGFVPDKKRIKGRFNAMNNPTINVVYSKIKCTVKLLLEDEAGRLLPNIKATLVQNGDWGDSYKFILPSVDGFTQTQKQITGKFRVPNETREIHYQPKQVSLTVNYLNSQTHKPIPHYDTERTKELAGSTYSTDPLNIDGFLLREIPKNASGVVGSKPIVVNFNYEPMKASIIFHYNDTTFNTLRPDDKLTGYFGQHYDFKPKQLDGFKFLEANGKLKGTFTAGRLDVDLTYQPQKVEFDLIPTNQYGHQINKYYNQHITGLAKQTFSVRMPDIPGFSLAKHVINGHINAKYDKKIFPINYQPEKQKVIIHTLIKGGNRDGQQPYKDDVLSGATAEKFEYSIKPKTGYHTKDRTIKGVFSATTQDITVIYAVDTENYTINFIDKNKKVVGTVPEHEGYYGEGIDVNSQIPNGYYLPAGQTDAKLRLNGAGHYNITVIPKTITITLVAQTEDNQDLTKSREIIGAFKEPQTVEVPQVDGYQPIHGNKIDLSFDLAKGTHETIPIKYAPEERSITVRFISVQGEEIHKPIVKKGHYNESWTVQAVKIDNYSVVDSAIKRGVFGLNNASTAFVYRAGSDEFSAATASLQDILGEQQSQEKQENTDRAVITNDSPKDEEVAVKPSNNNSVSAAEAKLNYHRDMIPNAKPNSTDNNIDSLINQSQPSNKGAKELQDFMNQNAKSKVPEVNRPETSAQSNETQQDHEKSGTGQPANLLNKFYKENNKD
ncbi:MucBP domain-containing protein [Lactobacillus crispatus]|uniref:MucBP domain-containing protein n=1 Tax=Lactobacillus crispatus TaxID=47770 RepID=A0AAW8WJW9_9LACO|nr:MucBP domain-containing protein [Lactobacillus crispatus]MCZ3785623.1 MucBP domain-containing protein [Lactobacillus crispatus]MCZ3793215.1 MucBP domain-containing protein [Lactobacillus crispatus]MDT9609350.1 MucBP domain-containing protein [Lactobacillus crispatus]MDT9616995.1 MucBP domain-containing protein [Lactobacillus crispatus]UAY40857.1 MucBP domain-containing protein [Lactobacillus crispatus]